MNSNVIPSLIHTQSNIRIIYVYNIRKEAEGERKREREKERERWKRNRREEEEEKGRETVPTRQDYLFRYCKSSPKCIWAALIRNIN